MPITTTSSNEPDSGGQPKACRVIELKISDFRNYRRLEAKPGAGAVVLTGPNGAGKTNLLEAVSFLSPGRGLRRAAYGDVTRAGAAGGWAVWASVEGPAGQAEIGTGLAAGSQGSRRDVRLDGTRNAAASELADFTRILWLTPAMDGLFGGPAADRRRFLDRFVAAIAPGHGRHVTAFEAAMRQRNAVLETAAPDQRWLDGLEAQMAEHGIAIAAARGDTVALLQGVMDKRPDDAFPQAGLAIEGELEAELAAMPALEAEDRYRDRLAAGRGADRAAGRTLVGPHRSDLTVTHIAKQQGARLCSTGEQKILLAGLVLAHAALVREMNAGFAPILLLDEVAAHLDAGHRLALFEEIARLGCQAWMTGTDDGLFDAVDGDASRYRIEAGELSSQAAR